ncbi:thymidine phosphorylase family protein [Marinobacterium arenosum]|uniref:thymidine phosphorylase family protein n=1 Tax=Marinobacterium arenosum TaxID=2862496 RepID=UPI001C942FDE|nr:thymidine phosphorylase family protein [Marinobacterium arenosum]MBY4676553.1 thymidine phosphorylase family protein [Marinobacterium arenosum]
MPDLHILTALNMGIDTHDEPVVYMREDCDICRAEGFESSSRLTVGYQGRRLIATLNVVAPSVLPPGHIGLSRIAWRSLHLLDSDRVSVGHAPLVASMSAVRKKLYGHRLDAVEIHAIIADISSYQYSDIEIASFISACVGERLSLVEIISLTRAMVECGERLQWPGHERIYDKHCIGGVPGNRTTPLVVAIASAAGLVMPKTSSRAITSPAGTADTLETLTRVDLSLAEMQQVVNQAGACLAWGGRVNLSPADDLMIRIERALDLDGEGQLIASVISKKVAAGSTHVLIDIPVGQTAKVRSQADGEWLAEQFREVGQALGIELRCLLTNGSQPVGRGIGPVEEARDVLAVLRGNLQAPQDLRERALLLAAELIDMADGQGVATAYRQAAEILDSGRAWGQFQRIAEAQGGLKPLPQASYQETVNACRSGILQAIDNRRLARLAKLAGAPGDTVAGLRLHLKVGDVARAGAPLFTLFAESPGERDYALDYYRNNRDIFTVGEASL